MTGRLILRDWHIFGKKEKVKEKQTVYIGVYIEI
jgi:hypothetical protein